MMNDSIDMPGIEALIFCSENGISTEELKLVFPDAGISDTAFDVALNTIADKYDNDAYGFELKNIAGRYQFLSKKKHHSIIQKMQAHRVQKNLSQAAMETLAIIAYKQPCHKSDIESIRGVNCDYSLDKLLEKNLVLITGQSDAPGKPLIYETSPLFVNYLGINALQDLPVIKELITQYDTGNE